MFTRFNGNVVPFADDSTSTNRTVFGGVTQSDAIDDNLNADFKKGWEIVGLNDNPTREDFNAMGYTLGALTAYLYEMGISEWNDKQKYKQHSRAIGSDGKIYKAKTGTDLAPNVNNNPTTDTTNWEDVLITDYSTLTAKATPIDADLIALGDSASSFSLKKLTWANIKATLISSFGVMISTLTAKTTPVDADIFTIGDSAVTNASKKLTWANIKATLKTYFDTLYAVVNSSETVAGIIELATTAEAQSGTDDTRAITPLKLRNALNASGSAPIYACRAWVNFNGTGTVAIRASGNVSSITDNGVGNYTVNFTTAMVDTNYAVAGTVQSTDNTSRTVCVISYNTTLIQVRTIAGPGTVEDMPTVNIAILR